MNETQRPPWREPMVWLVAALPLAAIVGGIAMIFVSAERGGTDVVSDPVARIAQVQTADLEPDATARRLRLSAIVRIDRDLVEVLPATGEFDRGMPLRIVLHHPIRAAADRSLRLLPTATGWRAAAAIDGEHGWNVELSAQDGRWRLLGQLPKRQRAAHLRPALTDDRETP